MVGFSTKQRVMIIRQMQGGGLDVEAFDTVYEAVYELLNSGSIGDGERAEMGRIMGANKHDDRNFPTNLNEVRRLRDQLDKLYQALVAEKEAHRKDQQREGTFLAELLDAFGWAGGTHQSIVEGVRELRRALALWHCTSCCGSGEVPEEQRGEGAVSDVAWSTTCHECGGKGINRIAQDALTPRET